MQDVVLPKSYKPMLKDVVGIIPATKKTPDIYYCDDAGSEKVALITFLTMWFLDASIQQMVKHRSPFVVCALSPLAGGARLEELFKRPQQTKAFTSRVDQFNVYSLNESYAGRCYSPRWSQATGEMTRPGLLAIYAISTERDRNYGHTEKRKEKLRRQFEGAQVAEEDSAYHIVSDRNFKGGVALLLDIISRYPDQLDEKLSELLSDSFWNVDDIFDDVPVTIVHEIGHLISDKSGIKPTEQLVLEIEAKIKTRHNLDYFKNPWEALAELAGICLLRNIGSNANLNYGLSSSGLDMILPNSYADIEAELQLLKVPELRVK